MVKRDMTIPTPYIHHPAERLSKRHTRVAVVEGGAFVMSQLIGERIVAVHEGVALVLNVSFGREVATGNVVLDHDITQRVLTRRRITMEHEVRS